MADQLKLRGGPTAEAEVFVGAEREVTVDTGLKALRIHDGVTPGGHLVELATSAANSRSVVAVDATTARDALRVALEAAIATAEANRAAAVTAVQADYQAGDTATLASANSYTDTAISDLLGGSPDLLNTLNELAEAIGDDADFITTINASIAAVQADVDANETSTTTAIADGDASTLASANAYTDTSISNLKNGADAALDTLKEIGDALTAGDDATTALTAQVVAETEARNAAIAAEQNARTAADAATLSSANSYTDGQVASGDATVTSNLTALVTAETNARGIADTALDERIDLVQADVNQNEADSDAAIAAEEARALAAEASITANHDADEAAREQLNLHAGLAFGQLYVGDLVVA